MSAQTCKLSGYVFEREPGDKLRFANVYFTLQGQIVGTVTDDNGYFYFDSIPAGQYDVSASYIGFKEKTLNVILEPGKESIIEFILGSPCEYDQHKNNKECPVCLKSDKVVPIVYGLPVGRLNQKKYYYAGCIVTDCDPNWYCKRDEHKF